MFTAFRLPKFLVALSLLSWAGAGEVPPNADSDALRDLELLLTPQSGRETVLVKEDGGVQRRWLGAGQGICARFCDDGGILRMCSVGTINRTFSPYELLGGTLERFNAAGRRTWVLFFSGDEAMIHSDAVWLPNGHVLVLFTQRKTKKEAVERGRLDKRVTDAGLWADGVMEVRPEGASGGRVVWRWSTWDHLVQHVDETLPGFGDPVVRRDLVDVNMPAQSGPVWSRITGIDYDAIGDRVLLTAAGFGECWVIDRRSGSAGLASRYGDLKGGAGHVRDARWRRLPGDGAAKEIVAVETRSASKGDNEARLVLLTAASGTPVMSGEWRPIGSGPVQVRALAGGAAVLYLPHQRLAELAASPGSAQPGRKFEVPYRAAPSGSRFRAKESSTAPLMALDVTVSSSTKPQKEVNP